MTTQPEFFGMAAPGRGRESGVALVIVLSLLALLMIVSASFLFTMRIERAGAANNRHDWVANQIAHAGLDYALADIDHYILGHPDAPVWHDGHGLWWEYDSGKRVFKLNADTFVSLREDLTKSQAESKGRSFAAKASGFVPPGSRVAAFLPPGLVYRGSAEKLRDSDGNVLAELSQPEWIPVRPLGILDRDKVDVDGDETRNSVIGRYAFMAFDTTGLIDVNRVMTNGAVRAWGAGPGEIQLDHETFAADFRASATDAATLKESNVTSFMDVRDDDGAYVSFQDMAALNEYFDPKYSRHLKTFSYEPLWPAWTNADEVVDVGGGAAGLAGRIDDIEDAFLRSGLSGQQAYYAARGLIDYVDADGDPYGKDEAEKFCRPASERMPLMAGGMARFRIICRRKDKLVTDETGRMHLVQDMGNCIYRMQVEAAVPFSWMFGKFDPKKDEFDVEGGVWINVAGAKESRKFWEKKLLPPGAQDFEPEKQGYDIDNSGVVYFPFGWGDEDERPNTDGDEPGPLNADFEIYFRGATYKRNSRTLLRKYPIDYEDEASGMRVEIDTEDKGREIRLVKRGSQVKIKKEVTGPGGAKQIAEGKFDAWEAEFVAWVDVFDPRYAYKDMKDQGDSETDRIRGIYRPSHIPGKEPKKSHEMSILQLCEKYPELNFGLDLYGGAADIAANKENMSGRGRRCFPFKDAVGEGSESESSDLDPADPPLDGAWGLVQMYFSPHGDGEFDGDAAWCSSFDSCLMRHPEILRDALGVHVDGVRLADGGAADDKAAYCRAYVKNAPVESAGELGFLAIGPRMTVRLYDYNEDEVGDPKTLKSDFPDNRVPGYDGWRGEQGFERDDYPGYHTVLDNFAVDVDRARPGRISVDSSGGDVLSAAFYGMTFSEGKDVSIGRKGALALGEIVKALRAGIDVDMLRSGSRRRQRLARMSDFGKIFYAMPPDLSDDFEDCDGEEIACGVADDKGSCLASRVLRDALGKDTRRHYRGELEREELIARSCDLFTNRGRSFLVVVKAQAYTPGFFKGGVDDETGAIHAARTLVAEVWRDTIDENGDGVYPWKLVSVTVLDE